MLSAVALAWAFWIHPPGENGLACRDDGIALIPIADYPSASSKGQFVWEVRAY